MASAALQPFIARASHRDYKAWLVFDFRLVRRAYIIQMLYTGQPASPMVPHYYHDGHEVFRLHFRARRSDMGLFR